MPNHVTNKILFDVKDMERGFHAVCPGGKFDFETLVPTPPNVYQGDLSSKDEEDFPINWRSWNVQNWGTKWNCYDQTCGVEGDRAFIQFDTAWSVPYPILAAFSNKFSIPFEHRYYDEGANFWGVETWGKDRYSESFHRLSARKNDLKDCDPLCIELKGYDPKEAGEE